MSLAAMISRAFLLCHQYICQLVALLASPFLFDPAPKIFEKTCSKMAKMVFWTILGGCCQKLIFSKLCRSFFFWNCLISAQPGPAVSGMWISLFGVFLPPPPRMTITVRLRGWAKIWAGCSSPQ